MKFKLFIDNEEERVEIHTHKKTPLIDSIEELINNDNMKIDGTNYYGYLEDDIVPLKLNDIQRFYVEDDKTFASINDKHYWIKQRLYQIEEFLHKDFIKINKSCIVNINYIKCFNSSWSGTLLVEMINGEKDYVSRRNIRLIKERLGL